MRYRKLTADGDYSFGQGQADFWLNTPDGVGQACETRLLLLKGEWFLDVTVGTDYAGAILGVNTAATRDLELKRTILQTQGVLELVSYTSQLEARNFTVQATIKTIYGQTDIEVTFS